MRDEKEERKKQARSNKQTRQSNTAHPRTIIMYIHVPLSTTWGRTILVHSSSLVWAVACSFLDSVEIPTILWLLARIHKSHKSQKKNMYIHLHMTLYGTFTCRYMYTICSRVSKLMCRYIHVHVQVPRMLLGQ